MKSVRFALIVEIDASQLETDIYAEVETTIANRISAEVMT